MLLCLTCDGWYTCLGVARLVVMNGYCMAMLSYMMGYMHWALGLGANVL